jgi:hypothetical protein
MLGFITLAKGVIFDATNEQGRIVHTEKGVCLALDQITTVLLQSGLGHATKDEAIADLQARIEASDQQLEEGLLTVIQHLRSFDLLASERRETLPHQIMPEAQGCEYVPEASQADTLFQKREDFSEERASWEVFLTGRLMNEPLPSFSFIKRVYALSNVVSILLLLGGYRLAEHIFTWFHLRNQVLCLQRREWESICHVLSTLHALPLRLCTEREIEIVERTARRELTWCQFFVRLLAPIGMCLIRSVAFCAYLRSLGLPAQLVVGRERFCLSDDDTDFHAWVELAGHIVNDHDELQSGYEIMCRIPSTNSFNAFTKPSSRYSSNQRL